MKKLIGFFIVALFSVSAMAEEAENKIYIKVGDANFKKSLIAVPSFLLLSSPSGNFREIGSELFNTLTNDLIVSNLFTLIDQKAFLDDTSKIGLRPAGSEPNGFSFTNWKTIGAEFLLRVGYKISGSDLELETYLYYVPQQKLLMGKRYQATTKDGRATAHTLADDIVMALTGKKGIFRTKFVVASDRANVKASDRIKEIYVMDWDGRNLVQVSKHKSIGLSPSWSPDGKTIAYTAFAYHPNRKIHNADLFTYEIFSGKRFLISSRVGLNSGSVFDPSGKFIYLTMSMGGVADIYKLDMDGEIVKKITDGPRGALNVEPAINGSGTMMVFSSDRQGQPMIFTMKPDGTEIIRRTHAGVYNSSPSFSPDGKKIAFAGRDKGHFDIFIMNSDGSSIERLTEAKKPGGAWADNEDPSFSPDGRHIVFTSNRTGSNQIYIISTDGKNERRITADTSNYYKPRWSPYLN